MKSLHDDPRWAMGRTGELEVAEMLKRHGWYVVPSYDYSGEDGNKAPKLQGQTVELVIPDLDIAKDGRRLWAEVKTKECATWTRTTQQFEHGVPLRHLQSYQRVQAITGCQVWLFFLERATGAILAQAIDALQDRCRIYIGPRMSRGGMAFFPRSAFRLVKTERKVVAS